MSGATTPRLDAPPKQMSSRLLTMKFMQRSATGTPTTPSSEPTSKRRKTTHTTTTPDSSVPTTPISEPRLYADKSDVRAAIKANSAYEALLAARRSELGFANNTVETEWVLDVDWPVERQDEDGDEEDDDATTSGSDDEGVEGNGRQTYGAFKRKKKGGVTTTIETSTPARETDGLDFDFLDSEEEGEAFSDEDDDDEDETSRTRSGKKRKSTTGLDLDDDVAMSALDKVDLSKSSYAKSKKAGLPFTGAKPNHKPAFDRGRHHNDRRGNKHPKKDKGRGKQYGKKVK
ncbi:hypothetical protein LTS08_004597 [Lithohypha guttulata]|uniref:uncharacterized protein n=1 Tax=Lithohypha guttulata TaxID=1690604 RepID=UPI002DDFE0F9|nr:hypothetical protein LTR51_006142 [Lithohypha guttulata]KAK5100991.1 hypothetical protein LTS08_004597 [Lithohypha guttulata]